jgi:eukaryotic-like serine/threonine-protein kinase
VRWLSDAAVDHLRAVADRPDLSATPYELAEAIARGGMGTVYRARDRRLEREVALKVMDAPAPSPPEIERMRDEARILARLEHPGIVPVHDLGTLPDGRLFYVMKLVRGRRLDEAARDQPLHARLRAFERVCEAVAFAHAQGVVHRDLKPENVMVGPFGEVLVLDWGIAKILGGTAPGAATASGGEFTSPERAGGLGGAPLAPPSSIDDPEGMVLGTPGFMAPEQARGDTALVDERADVHALGAVLRYLLAPKGEERAPAALEAICARAMAAQPGDRYASVGELAAEVERFLASLPVRAHPEGPVERVRRLAVKYRTPLLLVTAYLLMRVVLALFARV